MKRHLAILRLCAYFVTLKKKLQSDNAISTTVTVTVVAQWAKAPGTYILLCCGFDSRRHTQILYKENRKMLFEAQKNKGK
jgi:hypothetical protein